MRRFLLPLLVLPLLLPATASAGTVRLERPPLDLLQHAVRYSAAPGEANLVTIDVAGTEATVKDSGAPVEIADPRCARIDAHTARCETETAPEPSFIDAVVASLGDRDDRIAVSFPPASRPPRARAPVPTMAALFLDAGPGADALDAARADIVGPRGGPGSVLRGGPGRDMLTGGPRRDWLYGGPDADVLRGGAGPDELSGDGPSRPGPRGNDVLDGGAGIDLATYAERLAPVVVDLRRGVGGRRRESDRLRAIENVAGGAGRDLLLGDDRANMLSGFAPPLATPRAGDVIVGRGGNDTLVGTVRGARFDAGAGADTLHSLSRGDRLACGRGGDTLGELRSGVLVPRDCEWVDLMGAGLLSRGMVRGGRAYFWLRGSRSGGGGTCAGSVSLRSPAGVRYGGASWPTGARGRLSFPLNAAGRSAAALHRIALVRGGCAFAPLGWRTRL